MVVNWVACWGLPRVGTMVGRRVGWWELKLGDQMVAPRVVDLVVLKADQMVASLDNWKVDNSVEMKAALLAEQLVGMSAAQ